MEQLSVFQKVWKIFLSQTFIQIKEIGNENFFGINLNIFFQIFSRSRSSSSSTTTSISRPTSTKPTKENIQNNLEADQNQNPSKKSRLNSDTDSSRLKSGDSKEMSSSSNNPTINAEPIEQRCGSSDTFTNFEFRIYEFF